MADAYPIPAERHRAELVVDRSRFIATVEHTPSVEAARAFIAAMRREFSDARHNVYAFAVGHGASITHGMSDDGEPAGTAGRPALAVVRGSGLGDVCVVVTRYFGGAKLGTGGLVRAYTQATQHVLAEVPRAMKVERRVMELTLPYSLYEPCKRLVAQHGGAIESEVFEADVTLRVTLAVSQLELFLEALRDVAAGRAAVEPR